MRDFFAELLSLNLHFVKNVHLQLFIYRCYYMYSYLLFFNAAYTVKPAVAANFNYIVVTCQFQPLKKYLYFSLLAPM